MSWTIIKRVWSARCIAALALIFANSAFAAFFYNSGFEQPTVPSSPGYVYSPTIPDAGEPLGWAFGSGSGVSNKNSLFTSGTPLAGSGQVGFLQNAAQMTQAIYLAAGTYTISFRATQRTNFQSGTQTVAVLRGTTTLGQFTPANGDLQLYTTPPFTVGDGTYTFKLRGTGSGTDYTAFVDGVTIVSSSTYDSIFTNNVRIPTPGTAPLIAPALANATNNPPGFPDPCTHFNIAGGPGNYDAYHTTFSWTDAICQTGSGGLLLANINPGKDIERYYWAEGATQLSLTFSINSTYRGRGYSQPVFEFFHAKYKESNSDTAHLTFYVNPQLFDGDALPPGNIFYDTSCTNLCTGKALITGWFGDSNPYMSFGTSARCAQGNYTTNTSCAFSNASVSISLSQFKAMLAALIQKGALQPGQDDPNDWRLGDYGFNVEMPAVASDNSYIDHTVSGVQLAATIVAPPSVTFYINGLANGSVTMPSQGSFTLRYASQNATSCDLSAIQNGQPWYSYPNYGLSYDWGTVSGWGGPATFTWTATCRNSLGQIASGSASLTIPASAPPPVISNNGFELPAVGAGSYAYGPSGGSWTFDPAGPAGGSGVSANGSAFTYLNPNAPFGSQVGFIQDAHVISQSVTFAAPGGAYHLTFSAAQRVSNTQSLTVNILVDGVNYGTITPSGTTYQTYSSNTFSVAGGAHTIKFSGVNPTGDNTIFFDKVLVVSP